LTKNWAVVPVKGLTESKRRLSTYLGDKKKLLVEGLLQDVLSSMLQSEVFDQVYLISQDENVASNARVKRVNFLSQSGHGLNRAIEQANKLAVREKVDSLTVVLADIPLVEPRDFEEFFRIGNGIHKAVLVPSLKNGTNVMLTRPPGIIRPSYGRWSYSKHLRQAQMLKLTTYSFSNSRISFDVDTVADLTELTRRDPGKRTLSSKAIERISPFLPSEQAYLYLRNSE